MLKSLTAPLSTLNQTKNLCMDIVIYSVKMGFSPQEELFTANQSFKKKNNTGIQSFIQ